MKVKIKDYIQGLASFLDENDIEWKKVAQKVEHYEIEITVKDEEDLFRMAFAFGRFYEKTNEDHD